jgi:CheY-like chemotaxis protein/HPt (histidine-containing phosphotransfer) domain-containing protein
MTALRVLHVDDEPDIREVVEISLGLDPDFETRSCGSGLEALAVSVNWSPDIILLDVMMPVMDGPATLARLRGNAQTAKIPIVFMTARAQTREIDLFRSFGAVGVIPKPFDPMTLAASVRGHVPPVGDALAGVRGEFLRRVGRDADSLFECWSAKESMSLAALTRIREISHGLAGAAGIFGYPRLGDAAATVEKAVILRLGGTGSLREVERSLELLLTDIEMSRSDRIKRTPRRADA